MGTTDNEATIMFADIVGSTRLYEILGDQIAEKLISSTLTELSEIVTETNGSIIKTIGDEIMCRFPNAEDALDAAKKIHTFLAEKEALTEDYKIMIRIGAHQGPIIENSDDIFGDAVNIAARMAGLARGGKTTITGYTYEQLSNASKNNCQHLTRTMVKGKEQPIDVFDVEWEQNDDLTRIISNHPSSTVKNMLIIQYRDTVINMSSSTVTNASIGRDPSCDIVVASPQASREHCSITYNLDKFIFSDNSANGSYIKHNQTELFFHQDKTPLIGEGIISLGEPFDIYSRFLLKYSILSQ